MGLVCERWSERTHFDGFCLAGLTVDILGSVGGIPKQVVGNLSLTVDSLGFVDGILNQVVGTLSLAAGIPNEVVGIQSLYDIQCLTVGIQYWAVGIRYLGDILSFVVDILSQVVGIQTAAGIADCKEGEDIYYLHLQGCRART